MSTSKDSPAYKAYQKYIKSKEFEKVKEKVFERDNGHCVCCNGCPDDYVEGKKSTKRSLQCHHKTYEHLYDELNHLEDMATICNICHLAIHRSPSNFSRFKLKEKEDE